MNVIIDAIPVNLPEELSPFAPTEDPDVESDDPAPDVPDGEKSPDGILSPLMSAPPIPKF